MGRFKDTIDNLRHANENAQKLQQAEKENGMLKAGLVVGGVSFLLTGIECVRIRIELSGTRKELKAEKQDHLNNNKKCAELEAELKALKDDLAKKGIIIPDKPEEPDNFNEV